MPDEFTSPLIYEQPPSKRSLKYLTGEKQSSGEKRTRGQEDDSLDTCWRGLNGP